MCDLQRQRAGRVFLTASPAETEEVGKILGEAMLPMLGAPERPFVALYGDLGAGKTVFVRGLASTLSPGSRVKSPTFTLVNEYRRGPVPVFHFDLYRVEDPGELEGFGFEDYLSEGVCVAEWSERLGEALPKDAVVVRIEKTGADGRRVTIEPFPGGKS